MSLACLARLWLGSSPAVGCVASPGPSSHTAVGRSAIAAPATASPAHSWQPKILSNSSPTYLPDFSYAGFCEGETPLPEQPVTPDSSDFGAGPDDGNDDTYA